MQVQDLGLDGVLLLTPRVFQDDRGYFFESYNARTFESAVGQAVHFVQDNESYSGHNVLRGLHYQLINPQGKLVRVVQGEIFDVAVDVRRESPTFGKWVGVTLSSRNKQQLWVPVGFAHGFLVRSEAAIVAYKATDFYTPEGDRSILWNDPNIGIDWPLVGEPDVSAKDAAAIAFADAEVFE
jgi:dTDP-4-dehydrorhamnose 3,5-epimerase